MNDQILTLASSSFPPCPFLNYFSIFIAYLNWQRRKTTCFEFSRFFKILFSHFFPQYHTYFFQNIKTLKTSSLEFPPCDEGFRRNSNNKVPFLPF